MFRLDELTEDTGNEIVLGVSRGDDDIRNGRWCGRGHVLNRGSGDMVFRDMKASYMHFGSRVQSFELLQSLICEDVILIDPLILQ